LKILKNGEKITKLLYKYLVIRKINYLLILVVLLNSCSSIPKNTQDGCAIFSERYLWYKHTKKTYKKYGVPIYLQLAIIKQESDFNWLAKPRRNKLFKIVPYKRPSSSFGYSQAVKGTWKQYKKETNNPFAMRNRFKDSSDFIGWYVDKSYKILKIPKTDVYRNYIAYHEGWGNYKNYKNNSKVIILAKKVKQKANIYKKQLKNCEKKLNKKKYIIF
jgi:hypothetical protein